MSRNSPEWTASKQAAAADSAAAPCATTQGLATVATVATVASVASVNNGTIVFATFPHIAPLLNWFTLVPSMLVGVGNV